MTDAVVTSRFGAPSHRSGLTAALMHWLSRTMIANGTRRALGGLPDDALKDIGLTRGDIPHVADTLAARKRPYAFVVAVAASVATLIPHAALAQNTPVERGKYLVTFGGCNDCHTPGYFFGKPDMTRFLGGSEVGFEIPGLGVFHGPNLTPDRDTGLGKWSAADIAKAITTGERPDGRILAPIMPWHAFANLTRQDVAAIVAFLQSLPPVKNKVPGPFGPSEKPTSFVMKIVPPEQTKAGEAAPK